MTEINLLFRYNLQEIIYYFYLTRLTRKIFKKFDPIEEDVVKFYFDLEESVPTFFSSLLLLFAALLLAYSAALKTSDKDRFSIH